MMTFSFSFAARSMIACNSAFCSWELKVLLEGQSILATLATHAARNSRGAAGGVILDEWYVVTDGAASVGKAVKGAANSRSQ
jgi:hypothetical protein